jgi:16S rRNA (adenine1518-N6/adenine1519-N6)-dimethyltransferase
MFEKGYEIKVVANLPYYITTPIIFKLLESKKITELMFMVQKEVGARFTGKPQTKDYNALSVLMKYKTESRIVSNVSRKCFFPEPNVDSVLLHIKVVKVDFGLTNEPKFLEFIRKLFDQRRKTIVNNLRSFYKFDKAEIEEKMTKLKFDINLRAEALDINQIVSLYIAIFES